MEFIVKEADMVELLSDRQELQQLKMRLIPLQMSMLIAEAHHQELHQEIDYLEDFNDKLIGHFRVILDGLHDELEGVRRGRDIAEQDLAEAREEIRHMAGKINQYNWVQERRMEILRVFAEENQELRVFIFQKGMTPPVAKTNSQSLVDVDLLRNLLHVLFTKPSDKLGITKLVHKMTGLGLNECKDLVIGSHSEDEDIPIDVIIEEQPTGTTGTPYMTGVQSQQKAKPITIQPPDDEEDTLVVERSGIDQTFSDTNDPRYADVP